MGQVLHLCDYETEEDIFERLSDEAYADAKELLLKKTPAERKMWQRALIISLIKLNVEK